MAERGATVVEREMGIGHADFFRIVPAVFGHRPYRRHACGVSAREAGRRLSIELSPEAVRRIGSLEVPRTRLRFVFEGYAGEEVAAFLRAFDRRFHRGGG